jgi:hypothetical protein
MISISKENQPTMKNFKALTIAALTALTTIAAPAANANAFKFAGMNQFTAANFTHPTIKHIVTQMNRAGVPVLDGLSNGFDQCEPDGSGMVTMGFYSPSYNMMVLCTNNGDSTQMIETLIHEATHMVQDCRTGLGTDTAKASVFAPAYAHMIGEQETNLVKGHYPADQHDHEYEARYNEEHPNKVVEGLANFCF